MNGVKPEELEFAKSSINRKFPANFETYKQVAFNLSGKVVFDLPEDYFNTYLDNINKSNIEDINKSAKDNIWLDKLSVIVVGDKTKLLPQLKELNQFKIFETDFKGEILAEL